MAASFVGLHLYASKAASVCNRLLYGVDASIDIRGTIKSSTLSWNGDVTTKSTIGVLLEQVSIRFILRPADH